MELLSTDTIERIATGYVNAPDALHMINRVERIQLRHIISNMFASINKNKTHFDFVHEDPYKYDTIDEVKSDFKQGIIKVNVSGNNSDLWGPVYNLMFRAIHDYIHVINDLNFTYKDEVLAYHAQIELSKPFVPDQFRLLYEGVLRSEIIYQAAWKTHFGEFHLHEQKIILSEL